MKYIPTNTTMHPFPQKDATFFRKACTLFKIGLCAMGLLACSNSLDQEIDSSYPSGTGALHLQTKASTDIRIPVITRSADFSTITPEGLYIAILDDQGKVYKEFDTYSALIDSGLPLILPVGHYKAVASSYKLGEEKVSTTPYFVGVDENLVIENKTTTNSTITSRYASLGVELNLSNQFKELIEKNPNNYDYKVEVSNGEASYTFTQENMEPCYFVSGCDELIATITVRLGSANDWYPERRYRIKNNTAKPETSPKIGEYYIINLDAGKEEEKLRLTTRTITD